MCKIVFFVIYLSDPPELNVSGDVVVIEGGLSVTLVCTADGEPIPNITWTRLRANETDSGVVATGNQFVLENNRNNSGTYRCTAYNAIGTALNRTVTVNVNCEYMWCIVYSAYNKLKFN